MIDKKNKAKLGSISMYDIENKNIDKKISEKERLIIKGKIIALHEQRMTQRDEAAAELLESDPTGFFIKVRKYPYKQLIKDFNIHVKESMFTKFMNGEVRSKTSKTYKSLKRALGL